MQVKLVSITKPLIEDLTVEEYISYVARVSNPNNQLNTETGDKLLNYCIKHKHWSIFEQVDMTVEIVTSRAIAAQILRHRSAVFQEFSTRYSKVQSFEPIEFRLQDTKNRQNSLDVVATLLQDDIITEDSELYDILEHTQSLINQIQENYSTLLKYGIAKECCRMILPLASTTKLYMKNNLRNWIHYIEVRALGEGVQKEHREIALAIQDIFKQQFPVITEALGW